MRDLTAGGCTEHSAANVSCRVCPEMVVKDMLDIGEDGGRRESSNECMFDKSLTFGKRVSRNGRALSFSV